MKRKALLALKEWKESETRKPLVIRGARSVGKTWLMKEFGSTCYENFVYCNFLEDKQLGSIFEVNRNPYRIVQLLSMILKVEIRPGKTLIIFDEIQECPGALICLKFFKEKANEYHVIAATSFLDPPCARPMSYPVGRVNLLDMAPLTFEEFLEALDPALYSYYESIEKDQVMEEIFHTRLMEIFKKYLIIGGMPECVSSWLQYQDSRKVFRIQSGILDRCREDIRKHNGKVTGKRILMVLDSLVTQLSRPGEKFRYGVVCRGGRAREFGDAVEWLVSAGVLHRVCNVSRLEHPIAAYDRLNQFKLYFLDTGLLKCLAKVDNRSVLLDTGYPFQGPLTRNYVLQQLWGKFYAQPRYYADKHREVDFVLQDGMDIVPVEVRGGEGKPSLSFRRYVSECSPKHAICFSGLGYKKEGGVMNIPLYLAGKTGELLKT